MLRCQREPEQRDAPTVPTAVKGLGFRAKLRLLLLLFWLVVLLTIAKPIINYDYEDDSQNNYCYC